MRGLAADAEEQRSAGAAKKYARTRLIALAALAVVTLALVLSDATSVLRIKMLLELRYAETCPLREIKRPADFAVDNRTVFAILNDATFRNRSAAKLSKAVQVDTQVFDNQPPVDEAPEVWVKFAAFHEYLEKTFPLVFEHLTVEKVNTYGLVFTYKGADLDLKPLVLMAHQDTVPVQKDTLDKWTYPPFEGHYDGTYIFGRGVSDCKNVLTAILETFELLLSKEYPLQRTVIASFGFDEEALGYHGAAYLAKFLETRYGKDSVYAIIDEGTLLTLDEESGSIVAVAGTGEKGYVDIKLELQTPGGHSSVPPDHTSIGFLSELASLIEKDPYEPVLTKKNPTLEFLQCNVVHKQLKVSSFLRKCILRAGFDKLANKKVLEFLGRSPITKYLVQTSQSLDIVHGGEKNNALPEHVSLLVNHRVAIESKYEEVKSHFVDRVLSFAKKNGLGVTAFGKVLVPDTGLGFFTISVDGKPLDTAPVSPTNDIVWDYLAGVTRHVFEEVAYSNLTSPVVLTPGIMTGNTDTKYYWNLTKNIFRYSPAVSIDMIKEGHVHSVDEKIKFDSHLQLIAFFFEYIKAIDSKDANNQ